ncbi:hypothetical protein MBLNU230_g6018t1 [Neophaeotheca triangularis]
MPDFYTYPDGTAPGLPVVEALESHLHHTPLISPQCDMPSRNEAASDEPRRRRKEYDRDRDSNTSGSTKEKKRSSRKDRDHEGDRSGKKTVKRRTPSEERERASRKERERASTPKIPATTSDRGAARMGTLGVPEMDRRSKNSASLEDVRPRSSYPTFSKAHSREAVGSREEVGTSPKVSLHTPEPTDVGRDQSKRNSTPAAQPATRAPPSPPLTAEEPEIKGRSSGDGMRRTADTMREETHQGRKSADHGSRSRGNSVRNARSGASLRKEEARFGQSDISSMPGSFPDEGERKSTPGSGYRRTVSTGSQQNSTVTQNTENTTDSDATSIAPERKGKRPPRIVPVQETSPPSGTDSQPKTPTPQDPYFPPSVKATPVIDVGAQQHNYRDDTPQTARYFGSGDGPMSQAMGHPPPPPPPPPPMTTPGEVPRVDYLLKHGGLPYMVKKKLVDTGPVQQYSMYQSPALVQAGPIEDYQKIFSGINQRLDDYYSVLRKNGSLAVATGYKSVARRLLDKLSQVFARDISSQRCDCVVCRTLPQPYLSDEEDSGISWGEILEFVSGRRELPQWPPFTIQPDDSGLGITGATAAPMQKLDIDVPEEYRDHYIRQNKKTKVAVQNWLAMQPEYPSSPPEEADEDTLMFAMMTKLSTQQRNLFIALMHGHATVSDSRAPTPAERPTTSSGAIKHSRKALQRLYRLERPPRDCESAMYLLTNPHLHGMLATLAEVQEQEWDILTSGRFDGFLWSGAEAPFPPSASGFNSPAMSRGPSRGPTSTPFSRNTTPFSGMSGMPPSRGNTPFSNLRNDPTAAVPGGSQTGSSMFPSRGPTPGPQGLGVSAPGPVQLDEDTEIAVLAEVERAIFMDMERLEDAFELLHGRAEQVRQLLRERSAGLSMQAQMRRGSGAEEIGARMGTPASGFTNFEEGESEDDGLADMMSLAPDDSASNISYNRRHRKRHERRTPAPVEEEDEGAYEVQQERGHGGHEHGKKASRRR